MTLYMDYLAEIKSRQPQGLDPKPIDDGGLVAEIIALIEDTENPLRADALKFFITIRYPEPRPQPRSRQRFSNRSFRVKRTLRRFLRTSRLNCFLT